VCAGSAAGAGDFEVESIDRAARGTSVILHLREDAMDYASAWKLKSIINKYSDHISLPILMEKEEWKDGELINPATKRVAASRAAWSRPASGKPSTRPTRSGRAQERHQREQYNEFYKQISHDFEAPLAHTHNRVEGSTEYTQLLYIPGKAPWTCGTATKGRTQAVRQARLHHGRRRSLLPTYLRFVKGVVDSADLPLNVSRELLQESRDVKAIREGCTKRVLGMLEDLAKNDKLPEASADGVTDV
jgi:molecular chaperone HtpG